MIQKTFAWILILTFAFLGADALNCHKCDSPSKSECITNPASLTGAEFACTGDKCYTEVDGDGKVTRGCKADNTDCSSGTCVSCTAEKCNKHLICQTCDSSNASCVSLTAVDSKFNIICSKTPAKCIINIKDKQTIRGCASDDDEKNCSGDTCKLFTEANSNIGIFPANRRNCYQCAESDADCEKQQTDTSKSKPCALYDANDKCYMIGTEKSKITRGCVSDAGDKNKCKADKHDEKCYVCDKSNCNEYAYQRDQKLKCIQCTSTKEDSTCLGEQKESDAKNCKNQILYNATETCYTQEKDGMVHRGCLYDRGEALGACSNATQCVTCTSADACNKDEQTFTCIRCRSDINKICYNDAEKLSGMNCTSKSDKRECFHGIWNGVVIRGCLVDADERVQGLCRDPNSKQCVICTGKNCNYGKTSGAASLSIMAALATVLLAYLVQLL